MPIETGGAAISASSRHPQKSTLSRLLRRTIGFRDGPILLQKSKVAEPRFFREKTKRKAIADSYDLNRIAEVACEFNVRR
jgi:hypothetical protein